MFAILALSFVPRLWSLRFVGFGVATHFLLDRLWETPRIVLYPSYGWAFSLAAFDTGRWFDALFHDPYVQAGEIVGAVILIVFVWRKGLLSWEALREFARHGILPRVAPNQR